MLTPIDIREKEFDKGRGYTREVRNFLAKVAAEYEVLYAKNSELTDKINQLESRLDNYEKIEDSMKSALILAQKTADSTIESANKEAENILLNAKLKADKLYVESLDNNNRIKLANKNLMDRFETYKKLCSDFLNQQKELLELANINFDEEDVNVNLEKVYPDAIYDDEAYEEEYDNQYAEEEYDDEYSEEYDDEYEEYEEEYDDEYESQEYIDDEYEQEELEEDYSDEKYDDDALEYEEKNK